MNNYTGSVVGVIGAGAMGSGIAQVAALAGFKVVLFDANPQALDRAQASLTVALQKLYEKGKITDMGEVLARYQYVNTTEALNSCFLVIEAIVEDLDIKKRLFTDVENIVSENCILASNTSSLSVTSIAASCKKPSRVIGLHFFNPAHIMELVEIIPAVQTDPELVPVCKALMEQWNKIPVIAKDTPGFIVNRVARPFYSEAIRIYEEGIADLSTIDEAMKGIGEFRMGPFELMDYIGHDVNYVVTETVFRSFFFDPRYKPSFTQKRLLEAGWLGRKSGRGFYSYASDAVRPQADTDPALGTMIAERIVAMLINEAVDAVYLNVTSVEDMELAMTKGVNYPKGLLKWCDEWGAEKCLAILDSLYDEYHEDRYRASALLRKMAREDKKFFS